jgi:oligopeptide/dipeptide ABC transporter ATP-binding protein
VSGAGAVAVDGPSAREGQSTGPLLEVQRVRKEFHEAGRTIHAVNEVSFSIEAGEAVGLVGESGCGKSTLGRCIVRLLPVTSGRLLFDGEDITGWSDRRLRPVRQNLQIVFQDPTTALNPRWTVDGLIKEPLILHRIRDSGKRVREALDHVELPQAVLKRRPHELSGGQRQRVAIARAIVTGPRFVVLDEPTASVDMSIRLSILQLLRQLQRDVRLTYLFISHDLSTVRQLCNRVLVMYLGKVVEQGTTDAVFDNPTHVYTQVLLSAIPNPDPNAGSSRIVAKGEPPSPTHIPGGCPFHPRCPMANEECVRPQPFYRLQANHEAACRLAKDHPVAG